MIDFEIWYRGNINEIVVIVLGIERYDDVY